MYGTTSSIEPLYMCWDIMIQKVLYAQKAMKSLARRFLHLSLYHENIRKLIQPGISLKAASWENLKESQHFLAQELNIESS